MRARLVVLFSALVLMSSLAYADYVQTNLVSDGSVSALHTDPNLINPWGIAFSATSPFWVGDNGTGLSTLYNSSGTPQALVVTVPNPGGGNSAPTGVAFNTAGSPNFHGDNFLFATENGTLAGWRGALGTNAETLVITPGADYTGVAVLGTNVYLADNQNNRIDVFNGSLVQQFLSFTDPGLPAGYAPFNIENINGQLYVTYSKIGGGGLGDGIVDVFDANGNFIKRLITGGTLADPWGLALAPNTFGQFGGDLLVGNFADGKINAFDAAGMYVGTLKDQNGNDIVNESLWDLTFGNGGNGGDKNTLYLTAGLHDEQGGLLASITAVPEPTSMVLLGSGLAGMLLRRKQRSC